jgi:serine/threonine-protein kinase HipA
MVVTGLALLTAMMTVHSHVPENEYTSMRLAEAAEVNIPEIRLVPLSSIDNLPDIRLPNEKYACAIQRFDRLQYEQVGRTIYQFILSVFSPGTISRRCLSALGNPLFQPLRTILPTCSQIFCNL